MNPSRLPPRQRLLRSRVHAGLLLGAALLPALAAADADQPSPGGNDLIGIYLKALDAKPQALAKLLPQIGAGATAGEVEQSVSGQFFKDVLGNSTTGTGTSIGSGNGINVNHSDQFYTVGYQVGLTQVLFDWSLFKNYDQSELQVGQAGVKVLEALDALRLQTAQAYFDVLQAQDGVRFAGAEKDAVGQLLQQAKGKYSSGMVTDVEVKQAEAEYDLTDAELIDAQNTLQVDLSQLEQLTGGQTYTKVRPLDEDYRPLAPEPNKLDVWLDRAQSQNLSLQDKHYATQIAQKEIEKQQAARLPTLGLNARRAYEYADGGITNGIGAGDNHGIDEGVYATLKLPIFTGGAVTSAIRAAKAGYDRAQFDEAASRGEARHGTQVAFLNANAGLSHVSALKLAVDSARAAEDAANVGYKVGTKTYSDVLLAVRTRYKAERDYAGARYGYIVNFLNLKHQAGTLNHADMLIINRWLQP